MRSDNGNAPVEAAKAKATPTLSVFCIDDDKELLFIAELALGLDDRISTASAPTADEALRRLLAPSYRPDCILLDRAMPDVDGRLLLGEIRNIPHHQTTPVIFLTAHVMQADVKDYGALGACGVITKPFDPFQLAQQVRRALAGESCLPATQRQKRVDMAASRDSVATGHGSKEGT
jgi:two-component system OmpR family response regulator